ncbi:MAG: hypothetical protein ABI768_06590 [Acidobacteriota bacterium]
MRDRTDPPTRYARALIVVVAAALAGAVLASDLDAVGSFIFPLDDTYIYLQYASRAADGHPFSYGPGEPASTGMTSLLYPAILAVPAVAGLRGDSLALFAFGLGALFLVGSGLLVHRLVGRACRPSVALCSALLVLATGPCLWGILSGMEIGLTVFLFLLSAETLIREMEAGRLRLAPVLLLLLGFSRPEAMLCALALCVLVLAWTRRRALRARKMLLLPFAAPLVLVLVNLALTGRIGPDTARPKSPLYTPEYSPLFHAKVAGRFLASAGEGLLSGSFLPRGAPGFASREALVFLPPLAGVLFALALAHGLRGEVRARAPGPYLLLGGWFLTGLLSVAILSGSSSHHFRYALPYVVGLVALLPPGADALVSRVATVAPRLGRGGLFALAAAVLLLWQLRTSVDFVERYGREARGFVEYRDAAAWMRERLPADERTAILDAGIVGFLSERRLVDLYGLTTAAMAPSTVFWADWAGSKFEVMASWHGKERPRYLLAHRIRWDENGDDAHLDPFRGRVVKVFAPPPRGVPTIGRALTLWEIDWIRLESSPGPCSAGASGLPVLDAINVADVASERAHGWRFLPREAGTFTSNRVLTLDCGEGRRAADGVRGIEGAAAFTLDAPAAGPARLALRLAGPAGRVRLDVNGTPVGDAVLEGDPARWNEPVLRIPEGLLKTGHNGIRLSGTFLVGHAWLLGDAP